MPGQPVDPNAMPMDDQSAVPPESHEMAASMPKASMHRSAAKMREITADHYVTQPEMISVTVGDEVFEVRNERPIGTFAGPKHGGMPRHPGLNKAATKDEGA